MFKTLIRLLVIPLLAAVVLCTLTTTAFAMFNVGAQSPAHPEGVSVRQESKGQRVAFFMWYGTRAHSGGGLRGGK